MMPATAEPKAPKLPQLTCQECRRENEPQRIYCHDCGARLDRSALAKVKPKEEDPNETRRRLKRLFDPSRVKMKLRFFQICKLVIGALLVAAVVQLVRSPDLPERPKGPSTEMPPQVGLDLENLIGHPNAAAVQYSEDQLNIYLAGTLKSKQLAVSKYMKFERVVLSLEEGKARITIERSLSGYSTYTTGIYSVGLQDGKLVFKNLGGYVGRMPLHPQLMQYCDLIFSDVAAVFERDRKLVVKLGAVELHPKQIVFVPKQPQT